MKIVNIMVEAVCPKCDGRKLSESVRDESLYCRYCKGTGLVQETMGFYAFADLLKRWNNEVSK